MSDLQPGERVRILRNDASVKAGSEGRFVKVAPETGCLIIDVDGRGRVSFTPDSVERLNGQPLVTSRALHRTAVGPLRQPIDAESPPKRMTSPALKLSRPLYLNQQDAAAELGVETGVLREMVKALALGCCQANRRECRYTEADLRKLLALRESMREFGVKPAVAAKILTRLQTCDAAGQSA